MYIQYRYLYIHVQTGSDGCVVSRAKDSVKHFHVTRSHNRGYEFGFNRFATLQDFVNHFANQPLVGSDAGEPPQRLLLADWSLSCEPVEPRSGSDTPPASRTSRSSTTTTS